VAVYLKASAPRDFGGHFSHTTLTKVHRPTALGANDVVMVAGVAANVRMLAVWQVQTLHGLEIGEDLQSPEDGRPSGTEAPPPSVGDQIGRVKRAIAAHDELDDRPPGIGHAISRAIKRLREIIASRDSGNGGGRGHRAAG
jgi:hypothetical protein